MRRIYSYFMQMSNIQKTYPTTNDSDLQGILIAKYGDHGKEPISNSVVSTLIGMRGLSLDESLMILMDEKVHRPT